MGFYNAPPTRIAGRLMVARAVENDGTPDWGVHNDDYLEKAIPVTTSVSDMAVLGTIGGYACVFANRTQDTALQAHGTPNHFNSFVTGHFGINDALVMNGGPPTITTLYAETRHTTSAAGNVSIGYETDVITHAGAALGDGNPYQITNMRTANLWLSNGRPDIHGGVGDVDTAIGIVNNAGEPGPRLTSGRYRRGIVFDRYAIMGTEGTSGEGEAVTLAFGHKLSWYYGAQEVAAVVAKKTSTWRYTRVLFDDAGFNVADNGDHPAFRVVGVWNPAAFVETEPGNVPTVRAQGTAQNIDLRIAAKGSGLLRLGRWFEPAPAKFTPDCVYRVKDDTGAEFLIPAMRVG